nr:hypothetical protein [Dechloromonas sp.]
MSILSDLAPENSKLPANAPHAGKPPIVAWLLALLMLAGGGIWLYWSMQHSANTIASPIPPVQLVERVSEVQAQPSTPDQAPIAIIRTPSEGSATIRNDIQTANGHSEKATGNIFQTMQKELETPSPSRPSERLTKERSVTSQKKEESLVVASGKSQAKTSTPAKQNSKAGSKKHEERDIEIISAIVK